VKQRARAEYLLRHLRTFAPYITPAKLYNLALNVVELQLKVTHPRSLPPYLKVEPTPLCHMACPGCAHGDGELKKELSDGAEHLRVEEFKRLIDPIADAVVGVSLSLRGEPLLGKELLAIAEYAHSKNIAVSFPTNLSVKLSEQRVARLVKSGVDAIYVSLDGATEETYRQYRLGGNFHLVLRNVEAIAQMKIRLRRPRPRLVWKFVIFEHNKHEIAAVQSRYRGLGFDAYELVEDYSGEAGKRTLNKHNSNLVRKRKGCYWAWHTTTVRADGVVGPCCHGHHNFGLGNTRTENLRDVWRGDNYAKLRRGFQTMQAADLHPVCAQCLGVETTRGECGVPSDSTAPLTVE
jgi:radical SAM protein with 4Fe4S-binding SPASM domain